MKAHIILWLIMATCCHGATLIRFPLTSGPFGGSQVVTLSDNSGATIRFSGRAVCTDDIPSSGCFTSAIVRGGGPVQFLISNSGRPLRLGIGEQISSNPTDGIWGANIFNQYEFLISRFSPRDGTFTPLNDQYTVGFRVREAEGDYRYGWIEASTHSSGLGATFTSIAITDSSVDTVTISAIPEPNSGLLILAVCTVALARRTRHGTPIAALA